MIALVLTVILFKGGLTLRVKDLGDARPAVTRLAILRAPLGWAHALLQLGRGIGVAAGLGVTGGMPVARAFRLGWVPEYIKVPSRGHMDRVDAAPRNGAPDRGRRKPVLPPGPRGQEVARCAARAARGGAGAGSIPDDTETAQGGTRGRVGRFPDNSDLLAEFSRD